MAVSQANSNLGDPRTQEGMHEYMKELRSHLLAVGMTELDIEGAYDASETGSVDQVPAKEVIAKNVRNWSPYMHFSFNDERVSDSPIVVSFMIGYGDFYDNEYIYVDGQYIWALPTYSIRVRVSQGVDANGNPLGATLDTNNTGGRRSVGSGNYCALTAKAGLGSFVRYTGDSLTIFLDHNGVYNDYAGSRGIVQLHIERLTDHDFAALSHTAGDSKAVQTVYYSSGSSIYSNSSLQARAGGTANFKEKARPVVAPVFAPTSDGSLFQLKRVFTVPHDIGGDANILGLDFTGTEKPYLLIKENAMTAYHGGLAWLYEWE